VKYIRDGRAPIPKKKITSVIMSRIRSKNTVPEVRLRKALWRAGVRGYRLHFNKIPGRPDICFPRNRAAIFVHGCYWHRCPKCDQSLPKSNKEFWAHKFKTNVKRDARKVIELKKMRWLVQTIWECQIRADVDKMVDRIKITLKKSKCRKRP
jgi:DNA mismatch endonuclease (patch repair protein)